MIKLKHILFPTDFSKGSEQALPHAITFSRRYNAELILMHAMIIFEDDPNIPSHHFPEIEKIYNSTMSNIDSEMQKTIDRNIGEELLVRKEIVRSLNAGDAIIEYATENDIELIVMGTHGKKAISHFFLGSVAEHVVRHSPCPVLTIREDNIASGRINEYHNILLPVDFSQGSINAVKYAVSFAREYDATLHILHVIEQRLHPSFYSAGQVSIFNLVPDLHQRSLEATKDFINEHIKVSVNSQHYIRDGIPYREIIKCVNELNIDMIVIATHGLSGIEHFLMGSTAEKVIRKAKCPVLSVKNPEREFIND